MNLDIKELQRLRLLNNHTIDIDGMINADLFERVQTSLKWLQSQGSPDVTISITSNGGICDVAIDIYHMLRAYEGSVNGHVQSICGSAAVVILQACTTRTVAPNAIIHPHAVRREIVVNLHMANPKNRKWLNKHFKRMWKINEVVVQIFKDRTGLTKKVIRKILKKDKYLKACKALSLGFVDEIKPV